MPSAARLGDIASAHGCFPVTPIITGSGNVFIDGNLAARIGDVIGCGGVVATGSEEVNIGS